jgi:hypothetical protein
LNNKNENIKKNKRMQNSISNTIKSKSELRKLKETYKFTTDQDVIYIGKLYENYTNQKGIVLKRSKQKNKNWYHVKFNVDNNTYTFHEAMLKPVFEQVSIESYLNDVEVDVDMNVDIEADENNLESEVMML